MNKLTLSARTVATLLGKSPWNSSWNHFKEKVTKKCSFSTSTAMQHGLKYESEALMMYQIQSGNFLINHPNKTLTHPDFEWLTGKIDGIAVKKGNGEQVIIEVKCPYSKKFPNPNENDWKPIDFYWIQVQLYMEILNINETHFCEYYKDNSRCMFRWKVITRDKSWFEKNIPKILKIKDEILHYRKVGIDEHIVQKTINEWEESTG